MNASQQESILVVHNKVPNRLRVRVPLIKNKQTFAELLKQGLFRDSEAKGIYHAEPSIVTGTILIKYHPALHSEEDVLATIRRVVDNITSGNVEITAKHKNPRLSKMRPGAFFTRELIVSIVGNVLAGVILAVMITG